MEGLGLDSVFWRDRPVLVTGATGLLGSHVVRCLIALHAEVVCLVRDWVPQSELVRSRDIELVQVVRGDISEQAVLERLLGEYEIATVFHLAAQTIVGVANHNPIATFQTNIGGTWTILEAIHRSPTVKQVIVASSDKAYGEYTQLPYNEDTPLRGRHPYDVSKACSDLIAQTYAITFEVPVVITRCGNFYGGGDLNWNRIVPGTIRSIYRHERPIIRSDGQAIRDYFYVEDAVGAYMLLAEKLSAQPELRGQAFNFSNETRVTVLELVQRILNLMGSNLQPDIRNYATHEIRHQYLSAEKARRVLGWRPMFNLNEGLSATIDWYRRFFADAG